MIPTLQILSGAIWLFIALTMTFSVKRMFGMRPYSNDAVRSCFGLIGYLLAGFTIRWIVFPDSVQSMGINEQNCWAALYTASTIIAIRVLFVAWSMGRGERDQ